MPTFILMTKLGQNAMHDASGRRATGRAWLDKVKAQVPGVRFVSHYAIFGPYDFLDIFETDDVEAAQRVARSSRGPRARCRSRRGGRSPTTGSSGCSNKSRSSDGRLVTISDW